MCHRGHDLIGRSRRASKDVTLELRSTELFLKDSAQYKNNKKFFENCNFVRFLPRNLQSLIYFKPSKPEVKAITKADWEQTSKLLMLIIGLFHTISQPDATARNFPNLLTDVPGIFMILIL